MESCGIGHFKFYNIVHLSQPGIVPGQLHSSGINVAAPDLVAAVELLVHRLIGRLQPQSRRKPCPLLSRKGAVQTGRAVFGDERGFDGNGTGAAEGVTEGIPAFVPGKGHQCRRQRLTQRSQHTLSTVASLVQAVTGGIQHEGHFVFHDGKLDLVHHAGFRQSLQTVHPAQPFGHSLFNDGLAGRNGVELRIDGISLYGELTVLLNKILPGQCLSALEQFLKAAGTEGAQRDEQSSAGAQVNIYPGNICKTAGAQHPAVFRPHILQSQLFQFIGNRTLHTHQGRYHKL